MCGIFGIILSQSEYNEPTAGISMHERIRELSTANLPRGNRQFGFWCWSPMASWRRKFNTPFDPANLPLSPMQGVIVHTRAPTGSSISANPLNDIHPFEGRDFVLMMNGQLLEYDKKEHINQRRLHDSHIDTAYLAGNIEWWLQNRIVEDRSNGEQSFDELPVSEALALAIADFTGQQACVLWHRPSRQLYVWRVMSTLYHRQVDGRIELSSAKQSDAGWRLFDEGCVYRIDPNTLAIVKEALFPFSTPYATA